MNGVISIILLLILIALPFFFAYLMHKNRKTLTQEAMKARIGSLYLGMNVKSLGQRL